MPLTLIVSEGVIPKDRGADTMSRLSEAFLELHELSGNKAMVPNVIGHLQVLAKGSTYSGLKLATVAFVEWKVPSFAFTNRAVDGVWGIAGKAHTKAELGEAVSHG